MNYTFDNATFLNEILEYNSSTPESINNEDIDYSQFDFNNYNYDYTNYSESNDESNNESNDESNNESNDESNNESNNESNDELNNESNDELNNESNDEFNCINFQLCKQLKNGSFDYCNDCFLYFYKKIDYKTNDNNETCPICFTSEKNNIIINMYECSHILCYKCIYNVYWDKSYMIHKPKIPYPNLETYWLPFLKTRIGKLLRAKVIYKIEQKYNDNYNTFEEDYYSFIYYINIRRIPKKIQNKLKDLVFYQVKLNKFLSDNNYQKYLMKQSLSTCPYCRSKLITE
jgi:hypothetical protein